jgi:sugar/nucleoside kinase (ribokinase family)
VADDIPSEWLANASLVLVSTMVPAQQQEIVRTLVSKKRGQSSRVGGIALQHPIVAVDSDQCWLREDTSRKTVCETMKLADIAFMNRVEWETFREIAREIPIVVLKRDSEGASVLIRGEVTAEFPAPHVEVVDVTGAGDVLAGTFLAHLSQGRDLPGALSQAIFAASQSITKEGVVHLHGRSNS